MFVQRIFSVYLANNETTGRCEILHGFDVDRDTGAGCSPLVLVCISHKPRQCATELVMTSLGVT